MSAKTTSAIGPASDVSRTTSGVTIRTLVPSVATMTGAEPSYLSDPGTMTAASAPATVNSTAFAAAAAVPYAIAPPGTIDTFTTSPDVPSPLPAVK
jgi:hypothetical protein